MNIHKLEVNGFGHFSGRSFDLDAPVVLMYGRNEAGKSTLMEFVRYMFFGFPHRSPAANRYAPTRGGKHGGALLLSEEDGRMYRLERYGETGKQVQLAAVGDTSMSDMPDLSKLLGGMTAEAYRQLFAFGLGELQEIGTLQGEEVSRFLFGAGLGAGAGELLRAEKRLQQEMDRLFRPKGTTQPIYNVAKELEQTRQEVAETEALQDEYDELQRNISETNEAIQGEMRGIERRRREIARLETALRMRDRWLRSKEIERELQELPLTDELPGDALSRLQELSADIERREAQAARLEAQLSRLAEQIRASEPDREALGARDKLSDLQERSGAYVEQAARAEGLKAELDMLGATLTDQLRRIDETWTESELLEFPVSAAAEAKVESYRDRLEAAADDVRLNESEAERLQVQLRKEESELEAHIQSRRRIEHEVETRLSAYGYGIQPSSLRRPYRIDVGTEADPEAGHDSEVKVDAAASDAGSLSELDESAVSVRLQAFLRDSALFDEERERLQRLHAEWEQLALRLGDLLGESHSDTGADDLDLHSARQRTRLSARRRPERAGWRSRRWLWLSVPLNLLLPVWLWQMDWTEPAAMLFAVATVWNVAIVLNKRDLRQSDRDPAPEQFQPYAEQKIEALHRQKARLEQQWQHSLAKLERMMTDVFAAGHSISAADREAASTLQSSATTTSRPEHMGAMTEESGEPEWLSAFALVLAQDREHLQTLYREWKASLDSEQRWRHRVDEARRLWRDAADSCERKRTHYASEQSRWETWLDEHRLHQELRPHAVLELIRLAREALQIRAQREHKQREYRTVTEQTRIFEAAAQPFVGIEHTDPAGLVFRLKERWEHSDRERLKEQEQRSLIERRNEWLAELEAVQAGLVQAREERADWLRRCGVENEEQLRDKVQAQAKRQSLEAEIRQNEVFYASWLRSEQWEDACNLLEQYGGETLRQRLEQERDACAQAEETVNRLRHELGSLTAKQERWQSGGGLADKRQRFESQLASLKSVSEQWAVRAFALEMYRMAKEKYERERQPRVLKEASRYFETITNGRYRQVRAPVGEHRLVAERENGERLDTAQLSRGTAEQLYLSMRLALAAEYAQQGTSLPLVMDDIFVNFDADRLRSALEVIQLASRRHQILLFTCHDHIRRLAASMLPSLKQVSLDT